MKINFWRRPIFILFVLLFLFGLGYEGYLWTLPKHTTLWNYLINLIYGTTFFIGGLYGTYHSVKFGIKSNVGKGLLTVGLGLVFWGIGLQIWVYYSVFLHENMPYPFLSDIFLVSFYVFCGIGVYYFIKLYRGLVTGTLLQDSLLLIILSGLGIFFLLKPDLSPSLPISVRIFNLLYPLVTTGIVAEAIIIVRIGGGNIHKSFQWFLIGLFFHTVSSFLYVFEISRHTYWSGDWVDITMMCSAFFLSTGLAEMITDFQMNK
jgi:hypothetical protein